MEYYFPKPVFIEYILYDPNPFYNLDEQVCQGFASGLVQNGWKVKMATVVAVNKTKEEVLDLYVICGNTYNWAPDWAKTSYIKKHDKLADKPVITLTVGMVHTLRAQRIIEERIEQKNAQVLDSKTYAQR